MDSKIAVKDCKDEIIFKVEGEFDNLLCIKYKSAITEIIARRRNALTIFDLSNVTFIDSSGIGLLIGRYKQVSEYNGRQIDRVFSDQEELWVESDLKALQFIFYLRAITRESNVFVDGENKGIMAQKGQGLRDEVFKRLLWVAENQPKTFYANISLLPIVGSWKDIWELMWYDNNFNVNVIDEEKMFALIASGLEMEQTCDLAKKYLPSIVAIKKQTTERSRFMNVIARKFMHYMGWNHREYRKFKTSGKAHDFQKYISQNIWLGVDYVQFLIFLTFANCQTTHSLENY
jgi:anti-anti-sigma factor